MSRLLVIVVLVELVFAKQYFHQDKSDWVDPGDTFTYNSMATNKVRKTDIQTNEERKELVRSSNDLAQERASSLSDENLEQAITLFADSDLQHYSWTHLFELIRNSKNCTEKIFFKRFIHKILQEFDKWGSDDLVFQVYISKDERRLLQDVVDEIRDVTSVDDIIMKLFSDVSIYQNTFSLLQSPSDVLELLTSGKALLALILFSAMFLFYWFKTSSLTMGQAIVKIFFLLCFLSFFWEWIHLYKKEVAKHHRIMSQHTGLPEACKTAERSWWSIFSFATVDCEEYFEKVMVDPVWKVTFITAVGETVSKLLTQPLSHVAAGLTDLAMEFTSKLPFYLSYPLIMVCVVLVFIAGYFMLCLLFRIGFKFNFFGIIIEPVVLAQPPPIDTHFEELRNVKDAEEKLPIKSHGERTSKCVKCNKSVDGDFESHYVLHPKKTKEKSPMTCRQEHDEGNSIVVIRDKYVQTDCLEIRNSDITDSEVSTTSSLLLCENDATSTSEKCDKDIDFAISKTDNKIEELEIGDSSS